MRIVQAPLSVQEVAVKDEADEEVLSDLEDEDDDEDLDLFGEATDEEKAARQQIIDQAKKRGAEKAKLTKSMIVLDVKPWDDTTGDKSSQVMLALLPSSVYVLRQSASEPAG